MKFNSKSYWIGVLVGAVCCFTSIFPFVFRKEVNALDVYRGKTTLEITYRDSVAVDSAVVYKVR